MSGELGAGKTTFVRGALRALGVTGPVTSPTFTIARRYEGEGAGLALDLHRLGASSTTRTRRCSTDEVDPARMAFVEWPEMAAARSRLRARAPVRVRLAHAGGDRRAIEVDRA